jgi:hypothetical protein
MRGPVAATVLVLAILTAASAQTASPFDDLDIGIAPVSDGSIGEDWTPLAESGARLEAFDLIVKRGDSVDNLLSAQSIRPDEHSRGLIMMLNPTLGDSLTLSEGRHLTFVRLVRPDAGSTKFAAGGAVAVIVGLHDRRRANQSFNLIISQASELSTAASPALMSSAGSTQAKTIRGDIAKPAKSYASLSLWNRSMSPGQARDLADQLQQYQARLDTAVTAAKASTDVTTKAATATSTAEEGRSVSTQILSSHFATQPKRNARDAQLMVQASPQDGAPCSVVWSLYGLEGFQGSRNPESLPLQRPMPVWTANLAVWIEKDGRTISPVEKIAMEQLKAVKPNAFTRQIRTMEACSP